MVLWSVETMPSSPEALPSAMTSAGVSRPSEWTVCTWGAMRYQPGLSFNCGAAYDGAGSFFARGPSVRVIFSVQSVVRPAVVGILMTVHRPGLIRPAR